jgi:Flp pilus assembly protein TadG
MTMNRMRRVKRRAGAVAVEFALIAQIFLFMLVASIDIVGLMNAYSTLQWAATTAGQNLMSNPTSTTTQIANAAQNAANIAGYTTARGTAFTATSATCGNLQCMTITGTYTYRFTLAALFCSKNSPGTLCGVNLSETVVVPIVPNT